MLRPLVECVPNFSEGRDPAIVDRIAEAIQSVPGIAILDRTMDYDHNRSVITFAGAPDAVLAAAVEGVSEAAKLIDLNTHSGVHPRVGAADVVPFVPISGVDLAACAALAQKAGEEIWNRTGVPVYLYGMAARTPARHKLEDIRRGGFEVLREEVRSKPERRPDFGNTELHPTAGATVVGARKILVAYNVNLRTEDISIAKKIAGKVRASSGGLPHVKALGLPLKSRKQVQVSMNLTDLDVTPLHSAYEAVWKEAAALGVEIEDAEIIGLVPESVLQNAGADFLRCGNFHPGMVLENRLADLLGGETTLKS